jgi:hypothetical protein
MATQRYISTSFWDDPWICQLDPSEKFVYLYLMTNPLTNIAGVYEITVRRVCFDTGYNQDTVEKILERFHEAGKAYRWENYTIIPSWPKHQKWETRKQIKAGIEKILRALPSDLLAELEGMSYGYPMDDLSIPYAYDPSYSDLDLDIDTDTEAEKEEKPKRKRFAPPTIEEITEYCQEKGVDPHKWHDHYTANGWMVGKNKMKDWKAAVRTWARNEYTQSTHSPPPKPSYNEFASPPQVLGTCRHCKAEGASLSGGLCPDCRVEGVK